MQPSVRVESLLNKNAAIMYWTIEAHHVSHCALRDRAYRTFQVVKSRQSVQNVAPLTSVRHLSSSDCNFARNSVLILTIALLCTRRALEFLWSLLFQIARTCVPFVKNE